MLLRLLACAACAGVTIGFTAAALDRSDGGMPSPSGSMRGEAEDGYPIATNPQAALRCIAMPTPTHEGRRRNEKRSTDTVTEWLR